MEHTVAPHYINGRAVLQGDVEPEASVNPATGEIIGLYEPGSSALAELAIEAASAAFIESSWTESPRERALFLHRLGDALDAHKEELADLIVAENGKLRAEALIEVSISSSECHYYSGLARTITGRNTEVAPLQFSSSYREAAGVAGIIVPWNAPLTLLIRSLAPALAAGCTCVLKPAPQTPLIHARVMELLHATAGLPDGVVNSVNENGALVGIAITTSPKVDVISFTGSTATGKLIMAQAASTLKRLSLELGGKTPILVFPDTNLDAAIPQIVRHCTVMAGQMCVAGSRVLVHKDIYADAKQRLFSAFESVRVGPGADSASTMGPVIDQSSKERLSALIADHQADILDSTHSQHVAPGEAFFPATILEVGNTQSPLVQQEHFGPIATLETFDDEADGVRLANATDFGLAASVWTENINALGRVTRKLRFGSVWHNAGVSLMPEAETGGFKQSGLGRLHGVEGLNDFLETKAVFFNAG
jgi:acyl-CoA reductase-like NAD-dependent aldehyde dehydrogenase